MELFDHSVRPVRIRFTENASPVDPRLGTVGELIDDKGDRVWACFGRNQVEIFQRAAEWLDDCHGRAGHTPEIIVDDTWACPQGFAASLQQEVQQRQTARIG